MLKIFKAVKNNMSEGTYLRSVNHLEFKENSIKDDSSNNKQDSIDQESVLKELDNLQDEIRHENLRVFSRNLLNARLEQFLIVTLPAILVAGSLALWIAPAKRVKTDKLDTYKRIETVISDNRQIEVEEQKLYYSSFLGRDYVDDSKAKDFTGSSTTKKLEIYITEELDGFFANITINSDGSLSISDIDVGTYLNLEEYDFTNSVEMDAKYAPLFDRVVDLMMDSGYISDDAKEKLKTLNESDKKEIVAKIVEYEALGETDIDIYKSNWFWRIVLSIIAGVYTWIVIYVLKNDGLPDFYELSNKNGELVESSYQKQMGLFHLGTKYKEAFLAAEESRIKRIYELCDENLIGVSRDSVLTSYEKKLVLGPGKDR